MIHTKKSDQFTTDKWITKIFENWYDPCPLAEHPIVDGLLVIWSSPAFVNPPYSEIEKWVDKGIMEFRQGKDVVFLLKFDCTTKWYSKLISEGAKVLHCGNRLKYGQKNSSPFPSALFCLIN